MYKKTNLKLLTVGFFVSLCLFLCAGLANAADVTVPGDPIVGSSGNHPAGEPPAAVIDDSTGSKYLNFDKLNTGFTVTPAMGGTRITGINLASANDAPERDPASYTVEGSTDGTTFSLIAAGTVAPFSARAQWQNIAFPNASSAIFTSYRVRFPKVANVGRANSMQVSEVELPGTAEATDTWAPYISKGAIPNLTTIRLNFSEPVDVTGATFTVSGGVTATAAPDANPSVVVLTTSTLIPGNNYTVTASGVKDAANNTAGDLTVAVFASTGVSAMGYSVDFSGRGDVVGALAADAEVGVVARKNWNWVNTDGNTDSYTDWLNDGNGQPSTVTLRFQANDNWNNDAPWTTPTEQMMRGIIKVAGRGNTDTFTWQNVPAGTYYMVTYHSVNCDNAWVDMTAGGTSYYFVEQHRFTQPWTRAMNTTDPNTRTRANYVMFSGLSPVNGNIVATMKWPSSGGDGDGNGMSGLQLVPAPGVMHVQGNSLTQIKIAFIDPVSDTALDTANYTISGGLSIVGATLSADYKTLFLDTDAQMIKGNTYWVSMNNIQDRANTSIVLPAGAMVKVIGIGPADIAVNFAGGGAENTPARLSAGDIAGAVPVANWNNVETGQRYWNDFIANDQNMQMAIPLKDADGGASPVTLTYMADEQWGSGCGAGTPNQTLMLGYISGTDPGNGSGKVKGVDLKFENVPHALYDVIVYTVVWRDDFTGIGAQLNGGVNYHYVAEQGDVFAADQSWRPAQSTDPNNRDTANHVKWTDVYPDDGKFTINIRSETFRSPVNGAQLVLRELIPITLTTEPVDTTVRENDRFTLTCDFVGSGNKTIQWYENDVAIPGANSSTYSAVASLDQNGHYFSVTVANDFSSQTSSNATLTVLQDIARPRVVLSSGGPPADSRFAVRFSEPVDSVSAQDLANYSISGGPGVISAASLQADGRTVILSFDDTPLVGGFTYQLSIANVKDLAQTPNFIDPNPTIITFHPPLLICTNGVVQRSWYYGIGGTAVADITNNAKWPNRPDLVDYPTVLNTPQTAPDLNDYAATMKAWVTPPETGNYMFRINSDDSSVLWISPNAREDQKEQRIWLNGCCRDEYAPQPMFMVAGLSYFIQIVWKEGGGGDYGRVEWKLPSSSTYGEIPNAALKFCVTNDLTPPTLVSVTASPVPNQVILNFSKPMDDSTINPAAGSYITVTNETSSLTATGAVLINDFKSVAVALDGNIAPGVSFWVTVGGAGINDRTFNHNHLAPDPSSGQIAGLAVLPGVCLKEEWHPLPLQATLGNVIAALTSDPRYPCSPDVQTYSSVFDISQPDNLYDAIHSGGRLRAYITPSVSGNYTFFLRSDDASQLFLGTSPSTKQMIWNELGCCADHTTSAFNLQAGVAYYLEAIYENGTGGDYIHVEWTPPGATTHSAIPSANLSYAIDPNTVIITIATQPQNAEVLECRPAVFSVGATVSCGGGAASYQWYKGATAIPGANGATLTYVPQVADNGSTFSCQISVPGKTVTSDSATLSVLPDTVPPVMVSATGSQYLNSITITFSENVDPVTASDPTNYRMYDDQNVLFGSNNGFPLGVTLKTPNKVVLTTDTQTQGMLYTVVVNNVKDQCLVNIIGIDASITARAFVLMPYAATFEVYKSFGGTTIPILTAHPSFPLDPAETYFIGNFDSRQAYIADLDTAPSHNDYGGRISGWFKAPADGNYVFYAQYDDDMELRISTDANPANKVPVLARGCCNDTFVDANATAPITMTAGQMYFMEGLYKEGGGGDYLRIAVRIPGDTTPTAQLLPIGPQYLWTMMDPDSIPTLSTANMVPVGSLTVRGFNVKTVQIAAGLSNLVIGTAEAVLNGTYVNGTNGPFPNVAGVPNYAETGVINYNVEANQLGRIRPDSPFRGIPGLSNSTDNFVVEVLTYVHLTPGLHCWAVNSDDDFVLDYGNTRIGEFQWPTGRGAADSVMRFYAPVEGLYAMRLVVDQGGGGGNVEWWQADAVSQTITAINGSAAIAAYRPVDQVPPVINCPQSAVAECNVPVNFAVSAVDPQDGPVPVTCNPTNGSLLAVGTTTVTCTAADGFGNTAQCQFPVVVTDTVPPVLTCPANELVLDACGNPNGANVTLPVSALDRCAGALAVVCDPASGSFFPIGSTPVSCTATDPSQNVGTCNFTVTVRAGDLTAPVVTCPAPITAECAGPNGTPVGFQVVAVDNCDPSVTVVCDPAAGAMFPLGPTTVNCTATDSANNVGRCSFVVTIVDTVAPIFIDPCPDPINVTSAGTNAVVTYTVPGAIDTCGAASVSCVPGSGSTFACGTTTVTCTATDGSQNSATCSFTVTVNDANPPGLTISMDRQANTVTVCWPITCRVYDLQATDSLGVEPAASWSIIAGPYTVNGNNYCVTIPVGQSNKFFRLRSQ